MTMGPNARVRRMFAAGDREETRVAIGLLADRALAESRFALADAGARTLFKLGFFDQARGDETGLQLRSEEYIAAYAAGGQAFLALLAAPADHPVRAVASA